MGTHPIFESDFDCLTEKMLNNRRIIVNKLTSDFRAATKIVEEKIPAPGKREMIIKNRSVGINASDVNFSSGAYLPGIQPPFNCGFEAVGTVVAAGPGAQLKEGDHCVYSDYGAFSEYHTVKKAFPLPSPDAKAIPLLVSGLTAAIALKINGVDWESKMAKPPRAGLVTAAAGGTGQFAVQLMKNAGMETVIGTCSTNQKADFLKSIGATHVIDTDHEGQLIHEINILLFIGSLYMMLKIMWMVQNYFVRRRYDIDNHGPDSNACHSMILSTCLPCCSLAQMNTRYHGDNHVRYQIV